MKRLGSPGWSAWGLWGVHFPHSLPVLTAAAPPVNSALSKELLSPNGFAILINTFSRRDVGLFQRLFGGRTASAMTVAPRARSQLVVGMPMAQLVRILGEPERINSGSELLEGDVIASSAARDALRGRVFCMWQRPEGRYFLTVQDGKLASIDSVP